LIAASHVKSAPLYAFIYARQNIAERSGWRHANGCRLRSGQGCRKMVPNVLRCASGCAQIPILASASRQLRAIVSEFPQPYHYWRYGRKRKVITMQSSLPVQKGGVLTGIDAAKQLAAYTAVDEHILPQHKLIGIGSGIYYAPLCTWLLNPQRPRFYSAVRGRAHRCPGQGAE